MSITRIDHIGIAVHSIDDALKYWNGTLGLEVSRTEFVESQKIRVAMLPVSGVNIELLEPTAPDSPVAKFLAKHGEGIHHIAFHVEDIEDQLGRAKEGGIRLVHEVPFVAGDFRRAAFLHPKSTMGVLTEFCQDLVRSE